MTPLFVPFESKSPEEPYRKPSELPASEIVVATSFRVLADSKAPSPPHLFTDGIESLEAALKHARWVRNLKGSPYGQMFVQREDATIIISRTPFHEVPQGNPW